MSGPKRPKENSRGESSFGSACDRNGTDLFATLETVTCKVTVIHLLEQIVLHILPVG